jgi:hypothetical protein
MLEGVKEMCFVDASVYRLLRIKLWRLNDFKLPGRIWSFLQFTVYSSES